MDYKDYKQNPAEYQEECYNAWERYFKTFENRITENWQLFNNYSEELAGRKGIQDESEEEFQHSCLFIPLVNPSVMSRVAYRKQLTFSVPKPLQAKALILGDQDSEINAPKVSSLINHQFYLNQLPNLWLYFLIAQETFPLVFLKVSEFDRTTKVLELGTKMAKINGANIPLIESKRFTPKVQGWFPNISMWTMDSVFYDPYAYPFKTMPYIGTITPYTLSEIIANPKWKADPKKIVAEGTKFDEKEFRNILRTSASQESKEGSSKTVRYKILEGFHKIEKEDGTIVRKIVTSCGKLVLWERDYPYESMDIPDPFIPAVCYPLVNQIEGISTVDNLKYIQHGINGQINDLMDSSLYGNFSPTIWDDRAKIISQKKIFPGAQWFAKMDAVGLQGLTVKDMFAKLYDIAPMSQQSLALINFLMERAEIAGKSPQDILSGVMSNPQEKATKTQARISAASTQISGLNISQDVEIFKELGRIMLSMTQERLGISESYPISKEQLNLGLQDLVGEFEFDVPHLSGLAEKEQKIAILKEFYALVSQDSLFQNPIGQKIKYEILKELAILAPLSEVEIEKFLPENLVEIAQNQQMVESILPTITGGLNARPQTQKVG
ncbi:MAG: hypothetical protein ACOZAL_03435 [Patescibacteria group bacterium]